MKFIRKLSKPIAIFLSFFMLMLACPYQSALAVMIGTDSIIDAGRSQSIRDRLNALLAREDIQAALVSRGIDPAEARARLENLSDDEILQSADSIAELPAGGSGGGWGIVGIAVVVAFIILLITDLLGYTDMFGIY
jgi:hypothetical protein